MMKRGYKLRYNISKSTDIQFFNIWIKVTLCFEFLKLLN
jgi:hypothetical protein